MSNYTKATNFASKDALLTGNPSKIVKGTEIDNEFNAIATAVGTKFDTASLAAPGPIGATTPSTINGTTGTFSGNVQMASANGGQLAGLRNKVINGDMRVAQRGTSFTASGTNVAYPADRFAADYSTGATVTVSQQADAPSSNEFQYSIRANVGTADASIAAGEYWYIQQKIEGFNARDLIGKTFTLSFWVKSSKTGIHCVSFRNGGLDRSYIIEYTVSVANTWEQKSITLSGGLITAGTWNWTNGAGLSVGWALAMGSTSHTTAGAWQTGNFLSTSSQVNCLDTIGNIFAITAVQLEVGPVATPFEQRPYGMELALCQRYYWTEDLVISSATATNIKYPVTMRAVPGITGGGAGFVLTNSAKFGNSWANQTTLSAQTLVASAEL